MLDVVHISKKEYEEYQDWKKNGTRVFYNAFPRKYRIGDVFIKGDERFICTQVDYKVTTDSYVSTFIFQDEFSLRMKSDYKIYSKICICPYKIPVRGFTLVYTQEELEYFKE